MPATRENESRSRLGSRLLLRGDVKRYVSAAMFVTSRMGGASLTVLALVSCVFLVLRLVPGDAATLILGDNASPQALGVLRHRLGLDQTLFRQYLSFLGGALRWDLGRSLLYPGEGATCVVSRAVRPTAELSSLAVLLGSVGGVVAAELSVGPFLKSSRGLVLGAILAVAAVPMLSFAPLVTFLCAVQWRLVPLPGDPEAGAAGLMFAAGLLSLPLGAQVARAARASLLDQSKGQFLTVAKAKGAGIFRIWFIHALAVSAPPIVVVIAMQLGALLGGAVVLERLFERPGIGSLMLKAYFARDLPVLEGCVIVAGLMFVATQTVAAAIHAVVDPRRGEVQPNE